MNKKQLTPKQLVQQSALSQLQFQGFEPGSGLNSELVQRSGIATDKPAASDDAFVAAEHAEALIKDAKANIEIATDTVPVQC